MRASVQREQACARAVRPQQTQAACTALHDAGILQPANAGAFGTGQNVSVAKFASGPPLAFKPVQTELGVVIEIIFGEEAIDQLKRCSHQCELGEDRHDYLLDAYRRTTPTTTPHTMSSEPSWKTMDG